MVYSVILSVLLLLMSSCNAAGGGDVQLINNGEQGSTSKDPGVEVVYKEIGDAKLCLYVHYPENWKEIKNLPSIVFFYGGSWTDRNINQFTKYSDYYASKGFVCFRADYRVTKVNGSNPFQSLEDAKSAIRYIRKNAEDFHIDSNKLVASGGSAGGHLAAACAFITEYNSDTDDLKISTVPDALMLFNPVIDNGPEGYGYDRIGDEYPSFSPLHNIKSPVPPTIFQLGDMDKLVPVSTAEKYKQACEKAGGRCDLVVYEGAQHGFFNKEEYYLKTLEHCDSFLKSLDLL